MIITTTFSLASLDTLPVVMAAQIIRRECGCSVTITDVEVDRARRAQAAVLAEIEAHRRGTFVTPLGRRPEPVRKD